MKNIYMYLTFNSWISETPDAEIRGNVVKVSSNIIEITDEQGYTQIINLDNLFAVVY
jgi:hypothetical protein